MDVYNYIVCFPFQEVFLIVSLRQVHVERPAICKAWEYKLECSKLITLGKSLRHKVSAAGASQTIEAWLNQSTQFRLLRSRVTFQRHASEPCPFGPAAAQQRSIARLFVERCHRFRGGEYSTWEEQKTPQGHTSGHIMQWQSSPPVSSDDSDDNCWYHEGMAPKWEGTGQTISGRGKN